VFVPVAFMAGITGQFFWQFGLTITVAVPISLFIAFTLDPMLSARFARARRHLTEGEHPVTARIRAALDWNDRLCAAALDAVLRHSRPTAAAAVALLAASLLVFGRLGNEFIPKEDRNQLIADLEYAPGTSLATASQRSAALERRSGATRRHGGVRDGRAPGGPAAGVVARRPAGQGSRRDGVDAYKDRIRAILATTHASGRTPYRTRPSRRGSATTRRSSCTSPVGTSPVPAGTVSMERSASVVEPPRAAAANERRPRPW
jgi:multidrug efflux pump subunit AcrB